VAPGAAVACAAAPVHETCLHLRGAARQRAAQSLRPLLPLEALGVGDIRRTIEPRRLSDQAMGLCDGGQGVERAAAAYTGQEPLCRRVLRPIAHRAPCHALHLRAATEHALPGHQRRRVGQGDGSVCRLIASRNTAIRRATCNPLVNGHGNGFLRCGAIEREQQGRKAASALPAVLCLRACGGLSEVLPDAGGLGCGAAGRMRGGAMRAGSMVIAPWAASVSGVGSWAGGRLRAQAVLQHGALVGLLLFTARLQLLLLALFVR